MQSYEHVANEVTTDVAEGHQDAFELDVYIDRKTVRHSFILTREQLRELRDDIDDTLSIVHRSRVSR